MARAITKKRKQVVLKRDENGNVVYDSRTGRPLVEKTVRKSRNSKRKFEDEVHHSGSVTVRQMTPEELDYYSKRTRRRKCGVPPV